MAVSETSIVNMALARIGAKTIGALDTDTSNEAIKGRLFYESTRDFLFRSFMWRFASTRKELAEDAEEPDFEWDAQFILPADFIRLIAVYEDNYTAKQITTDSYAIEGDRLFINNDECSIKYIRRITDVSEFDPMFVEVLVLSLAMRLAMPLSQDKELRKEIHDELKLLLIKTRVVDKQETNTVGRNNRYPWINARIDSRDPSRLG